MLYHDKCGQDIDKVIGNNIFIVYSLSHLIHILINLIKCDSILVSFWKSTSYFLEKNPS